MLNNLQLSWTNGVLVLHFLLELSSKSAKQDCYEELKIIRLFDRRIDLLVLEVNSGINCLFCEEHPKLAGTSSKQQYPAAGASETRA